MKPKNFLGRKNLRRINALERMECEYLHPNAITTNRQHSAMHWVRGLVIEQGEAEAIRTKKHRA